MRWFQHSGWVVEVVENQKSLQHILPKLSQKKLISDPPFIDMASLFFQVCFPCLVSDLSINTTQMLI